MNKVHKKVKYSHVQTQNVQTQTISKSEQYYLENELKDIIQKQIMPKSGQYYLYNDLKDIFNKLQKLIISSIENEKQKLTNNMYNFQLQNANELLDLRRKQFNVNQSSRNLYFEQLDSEAIQNYNQLSQETPKILISNQINAIKSLYDDHAEALYNLHEKQSEALWSFNKAQRKAFIEFDIKQREPKIIKKFLCGQISAKKNFNFIQTDNILKLQHEHNKTLWELKYEHNKAFCELNLNEETKRLIDAIEESQTIYNKNIQNLELEQIKETHILQFEQSKSTREYNLQYVKNVESLQIQLLQPDKTKTYLKYMKQFVKKIIIKNQVDDKLTQEIFDLSIREILDNDQRQVRLCEYLDDDIENNEYNKYAKYNLIVQIVIFLHWTKKFDIKLNFNLISNFITIKKSEYTFDNSCLKLVFPNLDNLKNLIQ